MRTNFLSRINDRISEAADRFRRRSLLAERAAFQARLGKIALARKDLDLVRSENDIEPNIRVSILVNIADGLCHYYDDMSPETIDRFQRARALAIASNQPDLQARADSSIALIDYGAHRFQQMFTHLDDAVEHAASDDSETFCRICMLTAQTLHLANRFDLAYEWYMKARHLANEVSDDASMSAILHNMASIWLVNSRNCRLGEIDTRDKHEIAWIGADSTLNFDRIVGSSGLSVLTPLMKAQMRSLESRYEEASLIYDENLSSLTIKSLEGWKNWLMADSAWCKLQMGCTEEARDRFNRSLDGLSASQHLDDRAAVLARLSKGMELLGDVNLAYSYRKEAERLWKSFLELQGDMFSQASSFVERRSALIATSRT